jgi:hypothetical protein
LIEFSRTTDIRTSTRIEPFSLKILLATRDVGAYYHADSGWANSEIPVQQSATEPRPRATTRDVDWGQQA